MKKIFIAAILSLIFGSAVQAQTTGFVFQGKLQDGGAPANGTYQFQFRLFDASGGGNQIGQTLADVPVTVTNGIFAVNLDFGAASFDGAARFIEVAVRLNGSGQSYTTLNPRQAIASTPYAVKSLRSDQATVADNSLNLGGIAANQYVITNDTRLSDERSPLPNSPNYIQNTTNPQANSNFSVSGEGKANIFNAATEFRINNNRVFHLTGSFNTFVGFESGNSIGGGTSNSFFGIFAGKNTTGGNNNSFFGSLAGGDNNNGSENSFFGQGAGLKNTNGAGNSLFGYGAGLNNTTGTNNTFVGFVAGQSNTTESYNTFLGYRANGAAGITNATAIGANSVVTQSNTIVLGTNTVTVQVPGNLTVANTFSASALDSATVYKIGGNRVFHLNGTDNTFVGLESGNSITTGGFNAFFGKEAGKSNTTGLNNAFFGAYAGRDNLAGTNNAFFGANAGLSNRANFNAFFGSNAGSLNFNGISNSFFGAFSGANNTGGNYNSFFGNLSGEKNTDGDQNSFFGFWAGKNNTGGYNNVFVGASAGLENTVGNDNVYIGTSAGKLNVFGNGNVFIGRGAGASPSTNTPQGTGDNNIYIGYNTSGAANLVGAVAIGSGAFVSNSFTTVIGGATVEFHGTVKIYDVQPGGASFQLCRNSDFEITRCTFSSGLRDTEKIQNFTRGLELLKRLRPVTFNWKSNGQSDLGFIAEEVNAVEPLLSNVNEKGEIEGVKYEQITTVLVNSVREQQTQIESLREQLKQQQTQIEALKSLVCGQNPNAAVCAAPKEK